MEEFQMPDSSAKEVMNLFSNSSLYCNVAKNKKEYRRIVKETGIRFNRKFDSHVIGYCECLTENLNVFLWNFDDGVAMGILTTPTNLN
jgi:predicted acetyltransferase